MLIDVGSIFTSESFIWHACEGCVWKVAVLSQLVSSSLVNLSHLQSIGIIIFIIFNSVAQKKSHSWSFDQMLVHSEPQCGKPAKCSYKQAALMKVLNRFVTTMFFVLKCFSC